MVPSDRGATLSATRLLQAESERLRLAAARSRSGRAPVVSGPSGHAPALPATAGVFRVSVGAVEIRPQRERRTCLPRRSLSVLGGSTGSSSSGVGRRLRAARSPRRGDRTPRGVWSHSKGHHVDVCLLYTSPS